MFVKNNNICQNDNIVKVRVDRSQMYSFPFDVFYLIPFAQRHIIHNLFPYSLCLPPTAPLVYIIANLRVRALEYLPHTARKETQNTNKANQLLGELCAKLHKYFTIVPILPLTSKQAKTKLPGYFVAPQHTKNFRDKSYSNFEKLITEETILYTPTGSIRPVCLGCSRHILHLLGKCELGSQYCIESLILERSPCEQLQEDDNNTDRDS